MLLPLGPPVKSAAPAPERLAALKQALAKARKEFQAIAGTPKGKEKGPDGRPRQMALRLKKDKLEQELLSLTDPAARGPVALGTRDKQEVADTEIRIRGEAEKLGPIVPRGFLSVLDVPGAPQINPKQSGRLELAAWLTSPSNPLPQRVIVNRVWHHLFGQGIVGSVDNFGVTGERPSHPELLDHLARQFVADGWSIKRLVRRIVLSRTYQLSAEKAAGNIAIDPANRLIWRHSPRRLDAEEIRDATLAAAGTLNPSRPQGSPAQDLKVMELSDASPLAKKLREHAAKSVHRSIYLPLLRGLTPRPLEVFDFAEQGMVTGSRDSTTVAPQALYLLNDPFVRQQAAALSIRLLRHKADDAGRIRAAYRLTLGRTPTAAETERATRYLADYAANADRAEAWTSFCHALLASAEFRYIR